jgi:hypothetical protein
LALFAPWILVIGQTDTSIVLGKALVIQMLEIACEHEQEKTGDWRPNRSETEWPPPAKSLRLEMTCWRIEPEVGYCVRILLKIEITIRLGFLVNLFEFPRPV